MGHVDGLIEGRVADPPRGAVLIPLGAGSARAAAILRHGLLYWDRLAVPKTETGGECADHASLRQAGLLHWRAPPCGAGATPGRAQMAMLDTMSALRPETLWSVAMVPDMEMFDVLDDTGGWTSVAIELTGAVPVPDVATPMAELIDFKAQHGDLARAVHTTIDEVRAVIEEAPADASAILAALEPVAAGLEELASALDGAGIPCRDGSFLAYADGPQRASAEARAPHLDGNHGALLAAGPRDLVCRLALVDDPVPTELRDRLFTVIENPCQCP